MIHDPDSSTVFSCSYDRKALAAYCWQSGETRLIPFPEALSRTLHKGKDRFFAALHGSERHRSLLTAHHFSSPEKVLSRVVPDHKRGPIDGDVSVWNKLPCVYVPEQRLLRLLPHEGRYEVQKLKWFNRWHYDLGDDTLVGVLEIPGTRNLLVSVQRHSTVVIHDPDRRRAVGKVRLAGEHWGDPSLRFIRGGTELWGDNYDTLVKIDPTNWTVLASVRVQGPDARGAAQYIGCYDFSPDESICVVARPFSGDVVGVDVDTCTMRYRAAVGGRPHEVVALSNRDFVARDSESGRFTRGRLEELPS